MFEVFNQCIQIGIRHHILIVFLFFCLWSDTPLCISFQIRMSCLEHRYNFSYGYTVLRKLGSSPLSILLIPNSSIVATFTTGVRSATILCLVGRCSSLQLGSLRENIENYLTYKMNQSQTNRGCFMVGTNHNYTLYK